MLYTPTSTSENFYVNSYFSLNTVLGQGQNTTSISANKYYIAKYDSKGNRLWAANTDSWFVAADENGNVFDVTSEANSAVFLRKLDSKGNVVWKSDQLKLGEWYKAEMTCNSNGDVLLAGGFKDYIEIGSLRVNEPGSQLFIAKWTKEGKLVYIKTSQGSGFASIRDIIARENSIMINGEIKGTTTFEGKIFSEPEGGIFTARLIDDNNLLSAASNQISSAQISIFPNPTKNQCTLHLKSEQIAETNISVKDILGRELFSQNFYPDNSRYEQISFQLQRGVYFFEITHGNYKETKRIVIE